MPNPSPSPADWTPAHTPPQLTPTRTGVEPVGQIEVDARCLDYRGNKVEATAIYHKAVERHECWWECAAVGILGTITHWRNPRVLLQA